MDALKVSLALSREKNEVPKMNELLVGLSRDAVIGVFVRNDNLLERLAAYRQRAHIKSLLNKTVPVVLLSSERSYQFISEATIREDIQFALSLAENSPNYYLAKIYIEQFPHAISRQHGNESFSFNMKYLTLEEQKQLSLAAGQNIYLNKFQNYAKATLEMRTHQEALDFKDLVSNIFSVSRPSLDVKSTKEIYQQYSDQLQEKLIALLNNNTPQTDEIFKRIAYHLSQQSVAAVMRAIVSSVKANKAVLHRVQYLIMLNSQHVLNHRDLVMNLIIHADEALLISLNLPSVFNNLYNEFVYVNVYSDVARRSGEEMVYDKQLESSMKISFLMMAILYQRGKIINKVLTTLPEEVLESVLHGLRFLRKFVKQYSSYGYEWNFIAGKKITAGELKTAYARFLKTIYHLKKDILLDKYEKRLLELLLINVINNMPNPQRLSDLMGKIWVHPIINQRRYPFFDRMVGEKEIQIKTNLRDAGERAMRRMEFSVSGADERKEERGSFQL